ncbi:hypothetical protein Tco_0681357 [Tanacetum coccineum]|uniref:Uncharacterized protein n=1 Tax=Tanacetum coccineum TaxID=301880 RepID=A0ABQ4XN34_9ASTR
MSSSYFNYNPNGQRFVNLVSQSQDAEDCLYHKLYDILKQHQNGSSMRYELNDLSTYLLSPLHLNLLRLLKMWTMSMEKEIDKSLALISLFVSRRSTKPYQQQPSNLSITVELIDNLQELTEELGMIIKGQLLLPGAREKCMYSGSCKSPGIQVTNCIGIWALFQGIVRNQNENRELDAHYNVLAQLHEVTPDSVDILDHNLDDERNALSYALSWKPCQGDSLNLPDHRAQVDQGSQIKMIQVKEMMHDNDLKNSKSKDKGSKSRSQSMDEQSHYKQDKTITRQSINVKRHVFNVIGDTEKFEERDLNIGGDC